MAPRPPERPALFSWCKSTPHIFATSTSFRCGRAATGWGWVPQCCFYYQRTFFYVAGFIYALFGGLKFSVVITIAIFLAIGAYGDASGPSLWSPTAGSCTRRVPWVSSLRTMRSPIG